MNIKFKTVYEKWLHFHRIEIEPSTAYGYERQFVRMREYFGDVLLDDMTPDLIQGLICDLSLTLSSTTVQKYCQTLKLVFGFAIRKGYCSQNPMNEVAVPRRRHPIIYPFLPSEVDLILQQEAPDWVCDGIIIAYRTGMRLGEIYALEWSDINLDAQFISVQRAQSRAGAKVHTKSTKTPSGVRRIDIDTRLALHLLDMQGRSGQGSIYVFPADDHPEKYRIPWNISHYLRRMCRDARVPERNFHVLRHTHASILLAHGKHPKMVQERLGHADVRTTLTTYSHISMTLQREAVEVFENL